MIPYVLKGFWRDDDPFTVAREISAKRPKEGARALQEFWVMAAAYLALALMRIDFVLVLAPFYYLGQSLSFLIAYYEHLGADPDNLMATGVSNYEPVYNFVFLNNGYHNEHHDFPFVPGSRLHKVREIAPEFYENLPQHKSWTWVLVEYIFNPNIGAFSRVKRQTLDAAQKDKMKAD